MSDMIIGSVMSSLISLFLFDVPDVVEPPEPAPVEATEVERETPDLPPLPEPSPLPPLPVVDVPVVPEIEEEAAPLIDDSSQPRPEDFEIPVANARCIGMMAGFPNDSLASRYQFYRLIQDMTRGMTPQIQAAMDAYGVGTVSPEAPVMETIEQITNPVLRQAAPEATVAQLAHLTGFGIECAEFIDGQVASLAAADSNLGDPAFNLAIGQDALFLRQILLDSLYRLGADTDPQHGAIIANYQRGLVNLRNDMEFAAFDAEIAELEAFALGDLGDRLDMSNAAVNDGLYEDSTASAVRLARDMSDAARLESQRRMVQILIDIFGTY